MASTLLNGSASSDLKIGSNENISPAGRQSMKSPHNMKMAESGRKQPISPADISSRRSNGTPKAWQSGVNPITQRSTTPSQSNGTAGSITTTPHKTSVEEVTETADKQANDRLLYVLGSAMGTSASVMTTSGDQFSGIFYGAETEGADPAFLLKMVQQLKQGSKNSANGAPDSIGEFVGVGDDFEMTFSFRDITSISVNNVPPTNKDTLPNGNNSSFRTDSDISNALSHRERTLQRWEPDPGSTENMTLDSNISSWDQFRTNEEKFNVRSDYAESAYTTRIDRTHPLFREREMKASRMAREIEGSASDSVHVREERGHDGGHDESDEEQKYSGVHRTMQISDNKYTPPARRPPTGQPDVPGVPVDPAIILSEISGSEANRVSRDSALTADSQSTTVTEPRSPLKNVPQLNQKGASIKRQSISPARPNDQSQANLTATKDVEHKVLGEFKDFANSEKIRYSEARRNKLQHDKQSKINDLMKFAKNFKLQSEVPKDLVPILAKDPAKQDEIVLRARREAEELIAVKAREANNKKMDAKASARLDVQQAPSEMPAVNERADPGQLRHRHPPQQHGNPSFRGHQQAHMNPLVSPPSMPSGFYNHRQQETRRQPQASGPVPMLQSIPPPAGPRTPAQLPMQASNSSTQTPIRTPTSAMSARFNPNAHDFKPNPGANAFQPAGKPKSTGPPQVTSPSIFFGTKQPISASDRPQMEDDFNIMAKLEDLGKGDPKAVANGGIKPSYTTRPTWIEVKDGEEPTSYKDMYGSPPSAENVSPQQQVGGNTAHVPHQYQLPLHLQQSSQGASHAPANPQMPFTVQPQHHVVPGAGQHDEHRTQYPVANPMFPSPRMSQPALAYQPSGPRNPPMYAAPPNGYFIGPGPGQPHYIQQFPGVHPHMVAPGVPFTAPLMAPSMSQQGSQQGYNGPPQAMPAAMFTPPGQHGYPNQPQPPSGYPSPGRMAPQMMRQGSRQGQHQQMYVNGAYPQQAYPPQAQMAQIHGYPSPQPPFGHSPQQHYQYPGHPPRQYSNYGHPNVGPPQPHQHHPGTAQNQIDST